MLSENPLPSQNNEDCNQRALFAEITSQVKREVDKGLQNLEIEFKSLQINPLRTQLFFRLISGHRIR